MKSDDVDLLVIGGGMAGLTAAGRAATQGLRVALVERAPELGGSAVLSGAKLWTVPDMAVLADEAPVGDRRLVQVVIDEYPALVSWMRSLGVAVGEEVSVLNYGRGRSFDVLGYAARTRTVVEARGGHVVTSVRTEQLVREGGGIRGAVLTDRDGTYELRAGAVVLCTGGFQADRRLRGERLGPNGADALVRSNSASTGDGLRLATDVGAATAGDLRTFYGHLVCWPVPTFTPEVFGLYAQGQSEHGILLDADGRRFCDESAGDHANANAVLAREGGRALLVADEGVRARGGTLPVGPAATPMDKVTVAVEAGAHVAFAPTPQALGEAVAPWGYPAATVALSIEEFNAQMAGGPGTVPRRRHRKALAQGPLHAIDVRVGVTATHGGIAVDLDARVLDQRGAPISGLYAAGADAGGVYATGYAGGLAMAGGFATRAVRHLAHNVRPPDREGALQ